MVKFYLISIYLNPNGEKLEIKPFEICGKKFKDFDITNSKIIVFVV